MAEPPSQKKPKIICKSKDEWTLYHNVEKGQLMPTATSVQLIFQYVVGCEATYVSQKKESLNEQVTTAELYYTIFVAEHNLAFSTGDHFTKLCKKMFPDSKIAEGFACGATKTQAIIKSALAPALNENVVHHLILLSSVMGAMTKM